MIGSYGVHRRWPTPCPNCTQGTCRECRPTMAEEMAAMKAEDMMSMREIDPDMPTHNPNRWFPHATGRWLIGAAMAIFCLLVLVAWLA